MTTVMDSLFNASLRLRSLRPDASRRARSAGDSNPEQMSTGGGVMSSLLIGRATDAWRSADLNLRRYGGHHVDTRDVRTLTSALGISVAT
jgi:hypothetical protein